MRWVLSTLIWTVLAFLLGVGVAAVIALLRPAGFTDQVGAVLGVVGGVLVAAGLMSLTWQTPTERARKRLVGAADSRAKPRRMDLGAHMKPLAVAVGVVLGGAAVIAVALVVSDAVETRQAADRAIPYKVRIDAPAAEAARSAGIDLEQVVTRTTERVLSLLPHPDQVKINVRLDPKVTVPEIGVGAVPGPGSDEVSIALDGRSRIGLRRTIATWLPASLARVLFLKSRAQYGAGYGSSLGEAFVSEGLADHFVAEALPSTPPQPWNHRPMTARQEAALWKRAKIDLIIPGSYDYEAWFQGTGNLDPLPRWFGYTLSYRIVSPYLTARRTASRAVGTAAEVVYKPYAERHEASRGKRR